MAEKVKVDKADAQRVLYTAYKEAQKPGNHGCTHSDFIDFVLDNTHKTYKYVLVNALLAKAPNQAINPLCLQKKSLLPGSYDARTICHDVLVKFEKDELGKALGGSNEPFLNKPARFTDLDKGNAVRAGRDACTQVLGLAEYDADAVKNRIEWIDAMPDNLLVFHLKDGTTREVKWIFPSRSESWTVEMREKAAEQMRRRYAKTGK